PIFLALASLDQPIEAAHGPGQRLELIDDAREGLVDPLDGPLLLIAGALERDLAVDVVGLLAADVERLDALLDLRDLAERLLAVEIGRASCREIERMFVLSAGSIE